MTTQTIQAVELSAAEALAALIPTTTPVTAAPADPAAPLAAGKAVSATFIGSVSADLSVVLADVNSVAGAGRSDLLSLTDVLRPALEAAAAGLGAGVLDEARIDESPSCSPTRKQRCSR